MRKIVFLFVFGFACSSTESIMMETSVEEQKNDKAPITETSENKDTSLEQNPSDTQEEYPYLSSLSDTYFNRQNEIPDAYARIKVEIEEEEVDLFEGFRVQIFSGQNVALADTAAKRFRAWSASNIDGYQAETYTFFKAPFYRVHVGDFHDRDRAINFSNLLKRRFRDSWVVFDRVNPYNVPADTTAIIIKR